MSLTLGEFDSFREFAVAAISNGAPESLEELIDEWRIAHPIPEEQQDEREAIAEAIRDMQAGDEGRPAEEFIKELRNEIQAMIKP